MVGQKRGQNWTTFLDLTIAILDESWQRHGHRLVEAKTLKNWRMIAIRCCKPLCVVSLCIFGALFPRISTKQQWWWAIASPYPRARPRVLSLCLLWEVISCNFNLAKALRPEYNVEWSKWHHPRRFTHTVLMGSGLLTLVHHPSHQLGYSTLPLTIGELLHTLTMVDPAIQVHSTEYNASSRITLALVFQFKISKIKCEESFRSLSNFDFFTIGTLRSK